MMTRKATLTTTDYPAYELYTDRLRTGVFGPNSGKQLRLIVGKDRKVKDAIQL